MEHQLARLATLLDEWSTEATHPRVDAVVPGCATFAWLEGGHFLIERSHHDDELIPGSLRVVGAPNPAMDWTWSSSTRAACAGRTASHHREFGMTNINQELKMIVITESSGTTLSSSLPRDRG